MNALLKTVFAHNVRQMVNPRLLLATPMEIYRYFADRRTFRRDYSGRYPLRSMPILFDRISHSPFDPHYVYQAYWATRQISQAAPTKHVDISSNVPFVAQLAATVPVTQIEFRPPSLTIDGYSCIAGTIDKLPFADGECESVSCLHVIEHIGLGRYGDPVDGAACWAALDELKRVIAPGGRLYLSTPVGEPAVYFNGNYVFDPDDIVQQLKPLELARAAIVTDSLEFQEAASLETVKGMTYALGMFEFHRPS